MLQEAMDQVSVLDGDWVVRRMLGVGLVNPALSPSHLNTHPGRATSKRLGASAPSTPGAKAWRSTTRGRWRRTRSVPRGLTRCASGRSATCTARAGPRCRCGLRAGAAVDPQGRGSRSAPRRRHSWVDVRQRTGCGPELAPGTRALREGDRAEPSQRGGGHAEPH